jgi:hypothetical protein
VKDYNLLDAQDFDRAVEETGLDVGLLRALRFGMAYGRPVPVAKQIEITKDVINRNSDRGNVASLAAHRALRNFKMLED